MASGSTPRRRLLVKGNLDLRDSLMAFHTGGMVAWNGINEIMRARVPRCTVLVRHETSTGFAPILAAGGIVPAEVAGRDLPLGPFAAPSQFSRTVFDVADAAIVLSIQADLSVPLVRHATEGYLLHPYGWADWSCEDRAWLRANFIPVPLPDAAAAMENLSAMADRIRATSDQPILVFNVSAHVPGDTMYGYLGFTETQSTRIRRFNLALIDLASRCDLSIIDIDRMVTEHGARTLKLDAIHLTAEGCRLAAGEVVRVLDNLGCLPV